MACTLFGPIRLSDSAGIQAWTKSCTADGKIPKWTGPYTSGNQKDWMKCYCCDNAADVPPVDRETQDCTTLLAPLPGGIGVAFVIFEPGAQQGTVTRADLGRRDRCRYRRRCVGGLWCSDRRRCGLRRRGRRAWRSLLQLVTDRLWRLDGGFTRRWRRRRLDHRGRNLGHRRRGLDGGDRLVRRRRLRLGRRGRDRRRCFGLLRWFFGLGQWREDHLDPAGGERFRNRWDAGRQQQDQQRQANRVSRNRQTQR